MAGQGPTVVAVDPGAAVEQRKRRGFSLRGSGLYIAIAVILAGFIIQNPLFGSPDNLLGILRQMSSIAIMALGLMLVIMVGEIDLSSSGYRSISPSRSPSRSRSASAPSTPSS